MSIRHVIGFIAVVALAVGACSSSSSAPPPAAPAGAGGGSGAVTIADFAFSPSTITIAAGSTVTWTNNDTTAHTVTLDDGSATSDDIAAGSTFQHTFTTAGTFTYHCKIHPTMTATVVVTS
ncbi:MAG: cupredoxin domain-containing protein [Candidatus Limnocylindrales bacterium]